MKTAELIGPALDWAVAKALGAAGTGKVYMRGNVAMMEADLSKYSYQPAPESAFDIPILPYSSDWFQGGPIIEREEICLSSPFDIIGEQLRRTDWGAKIRDKTSEIGPTPLVAAMRCYVASKLGDEVEVPEGLTRE